MPETSVTVRDNGPLLVEGPLKLLDAEGNAFAIDPSKPAIALCRCGASENKPFCDGSHKRCGFESAVRAAS
jgi:CDGSH-type Zn-finger protein